MPRRSVQLLAVSGLFIVLTAAMTWPQALDLSSVAPPHQDVYFNMWRLRWFAHALVTPSARLFDANIFYPEPRTLALSDAMFVEGIAGAPLLWAGMKPVLVHNLLLLGAMAGSGVAMFALARYLTGSRAAGVIAGIVFAFAPYRVEHAMHMELQWAMWMPLAFLALHRAFDTGRWKYGLATGACLALQMLSSIYYGIFLAGLVALGAALLIPRDREVPFRRALMVLAAGAVLAIFVSAVYAIPYLRVHDQVGDRSNVEVVAYSARPSSYLVATPTNWLYGRAFASRGSGERRLFPGVIPLVLAVAGLLLRVPSRRAIVYLLLLVAAFETSLGFGGYAYTFLHDHVAAFRVLRAPARLGICVLLCLGVLAAYGYEAIARGRGAIARVSLATALGLGLLAEYRATPVLTPFPNTAPPIYRLLAQQPPGVVAEFPAPRADALPGNDAEYAYMSTFHWYPLVNGYSGVYPSSYLARLDRLLGFPNEQALAQLRRDSVAYVLIHGSSYPQSEFLDLQIRIQLGSALVELGSFNDANGRAVLYRLR
jgi:Dolichyl-phosphate-mannose-protein mannosyltransferase